MAFVNKAEEKEETGKVFTFSPLPPLRPLMPSAPWREEGIKKKNDDIQGEMES